MREYRMEGKHPCLYFVSSKGRSWIPAKTLFVFAPDSEAGTEDSLRKFAHGSGWADAAEEDGAVLILPLAQRGWAGEDPSMLKDMYRSVWKSTWVEDPEEIFKNVWCWETLIFAAGYAEGARFAGQAAVAEPNLFADAAMVNGKPDCFDAGDDVTDRWLVPDASEDWKPRNREIPGAVWFLKEEGADTAEAEEYFRAKASDPDQVKVSCGSFGPDSATTALIMDEFATRIRWKNSPDGTPARLMTERQVRTGGEYIPASVTWKGEEYNYYTRLPKGVTDAGGMPVVFCMHGHGEPAWMFAQKNGWPELQDETGAFVFVSPDSPENSWTIKRDAGAIPLMLDALERDWGIDRERIYLTGFSNGSMATCWYGTLFPERFAAISPWNSPVLCYETRLIEGGWEMPLFSVNGDRDHKMDLPRKFYPELFSNWIKVNGGGEPEEDASCPVSWRPDEVWSGADRYAPESGYAQGDRMHTYVFLGGNGLPMTCYTEMKDMPHGAIADEARAAWEFMKHFSRPEGGRKVSCDL